MNLPVVRRIISVASVALALWLGWTLANGEFLVPGLVMAFLAPVVAGYAIGIPADVLIAGAVLIGYLVGNRGFAQLSVPRLPLLPGELSLGLAAAVAGWRMAWDKTPLIRRDSLNAALLVWIALCAMRLPFDFKRYGFVALRDFALVYYALFFFLAQAWYRVPGWRRFLGACLSLGFALTAPASAAFQLWPDVVTRLAIAGVPVIFVKGDVATAFMAAGVFWFASTYVRTGRHWHLALTTVNLLGVILSNSRAAMVSLLAGCVAVFVLRERRIARAFLVLGALGALVLLVDAAWPRREGEVSRAFRMYESLRTVVDFSGTRTPTSVDLGDKPDNNQFRLVWWQAVIDQARADGPVFGVGFGQDLADQFVRRFYADNSEEFNVRSPHNFLVTVFARTGAAGFLCLLGVLGAMAVRTARVAWRQPDSGAAARWLAPWMIFISACFGVVLEGPMGAVVFWTMLGLANGAASASAEATGAEASAPPAPHDASAPHLQEPAPAPQVAGTS